LQDAKRSSITELNCRFNIFAQRHDCDALQPCCPQQSGH
jgi:hypothetical protein